jgi:hypothetical protein
MVHRERVGSADSVCPQGRHTGDPNPRNAGDIHRPRITHMIHVIAAVILILSPVWVWLIHKPRRIAERLGMLAALLSFPWYRNARRG